ncbi:MAG: hypothetical protein H6686_03185 [Fibrobacteria bacterium]|nr:hypothetical protein [Fibrobacteria bacterium]
MIFRSTPAILLGLSLSAWSGSWTFGGRVGLSQKGSVFVPSAAMTAEYAISRYFTWRTDLEATFLDLARLDSFALSVPTQLLWHPLGSNARFAPYVGPGVSASMGFDRTLAAGVHTIGGFTYHATRTQAFGIEGRWGIPDVFRSRSPSFGLSLTGNWNLRFGNR